MQAKLDEIPEYAFHGTKLEVAQNSIRNGLKAGGDRGTRAHTHVVEEIDGRGYDQPGVREGSTHIVVVLLRQFAFDCFRLAPGSLALWKSWNNVLLTEGKIPAGYFDEKGEVVNQVGSRPDGQGIPWLISGVSTRSARERIWFC